jgi:hypothetical protein
MNLGKEMQFLWIRAIFHSSHELKRNDFRALLCILSLLLRQWGGGRQTLQKLYNFPLRIQKQSGGSDPWLCQGCESDNNGASAPNLG